MIGTVVTFLLWPVMVAISYFLCVRAVKRFDQKHGSKAGD